MALGALLILAALALTAYNLLDDARAGRAAATMANQLAQRIDGLDSSGSSLPGPDASMPTLELDGRTFIGLLEIPDLDLALPVQDKWSEASSRYSPCRYEGSAYAGDLIIAGHNYRSHFGPLGRLSVGAKVRFTDVAGHVFTYRVTGIETIDGHDIEGMRAGTWDLTLFTCTLSRTSRITVRCSLV